MQPQTELCEVWRRQDARLSDVARAWLDTAHGMSHLSPVSDERHGVVVQRIAARLDELGLPAGRLEQGYSHQGRHTSLTYGVAQCLQVYRDGKVTNRLPTWPVATPMPDALRPVEHAVRHIASHDNGLLHVETAQTFIHLCTELIRAYPQWAMVFVAPSRDEVEPVRRAIQRRACLPLKALGPESDRELAAQHFVGTAADLEHVAERLQRDIGLVVCFDARAAVQFWARQALEAAPKAKLFGGVLRGRRLDRYDEQYVRNVFGFQDVHILRSGLAPRRVEVELVRYCRLGPVQHGLTPAERFQRGVTHDACRHARVATATRKLTRRYDPGNAPSFAVVAANLKHGVALQKRLPDWPILADGIGDRSYGLPRADWQRVVQNRCWTRNLPRKVILSLEQCRRLELARFDAVVMAAGTNGLAPALLRRLEDQIACSGRCVLVDLTDEHDAVLRQWAIRRQQDYLAAGFGRTGQVNPRELIRDYHQRLEALQ